MKKSVSAIILAAGKGERMGKSVRKQFLDLGGKTILFRTISVFLKALERKMIEEIILVIPKDYTLEDLLRDDPETFSVFQRYRKNFKVVNGGKDRRDSVIAGLEATTSYYTIVHDGVRPFVPLEIIKDLCEEIRNSRYEGIGTARRLVDTVVEAERNDEMVKALERDKLRATQTPQIFVRKTLLEEMKKLRKAGHKSELLQFIIDAGKKVKLIPGSLWLFKITNPEDLLIANEMLKKKEKRVVVIIGGTGGIGKAIASVFVDNGDIVVIGSRTYKNVKKVSREVGGFGFVVDVTKESSVKEFYSSIWKKFGRIDVVINSAGIGLYKSIRETTIEEWRDVLNTNLTGVFLSVKEAFKYFKRLNGGIIINIGSTATLGGRENMSAYSASKFGLEALTKVAAKEGKNMNIRVYSVSPRRTISRLRKKMFPKENVSQLSSPKDVARLVFLLVNNEIELLSGQNFYLTNP